MACYSRVSPAVALISARAELHWRPCQAAAGPPCLICRTLRKLRLPYTIKNVQGLHESGSSSLRCEGLALGRKGRPQRNARSATCAHLAERTDEQRLAACNKSELLIKWFVANFARQCDSSAVRYAVEFKQLQAELALKLAGYSLLHSLSRMDGSTRRVYVDEPDHLCNNSALYQQRSLLASAIRNEPAAIRMLRCLT